MSERPQEPASDEDVQDTPTTATTEPGDGAPESEAVPEPVTAPEAEAAPATEPAPAPGAEPAGDAAEPAAEVDASPEAEAADVSAAAAEPSTEQLSTEQVSTEQPSTEAPSEEPSDGGAAAGDTPATAPEETPDPSPRPTPAGMPARPTPRPAPVVPAPAATTGDAPAEVPHTTSVDRAAAAAFGRVDEAGTVWVRRGDGEHEVGQYPDATPEEAIAYFVRKFEEVVAQVDLFEQRLRSTELAGKDIVAGVGALRTAIAETHAVGDVDALAARVEALATVADEARAAADRARAENRERLRAARVTIVEEAEAIAGQDPERVQWRSSGERLRTLFEEWKAAQREGRLDKRTEDELWKRFSHARSSFDKVRRHHFAALGEERSSIRGDKEKLVAEAEALSGSTDWRGTTNAYRALMDRWKAAGRLGRKDDDALWDRFRAAQDVFFAARTAATDEVDEEFRTNLTVKEQLLTEAEALVPVRDLGAAKKALSSIQDRWEAAGKVPRGDLQRIEARLRAVETAVRDVEETRKPRVTSDAEVRAQGVVSQLEGAIRGLEEDVEKARQRGDARRLAKAEEALRARQEWLDSARATLRDVAR